MQATHSPPPSPHASLVFPGWQRPPEQHPAAQVWLLQQGAAQKLPVVGHSEPAGAAGTQTAPGAKDWQAASLVQLLGGFWKRPAQIGSPVSDSVQKHGSGKPPPHCTFGSPATQKSRTFGAPQVQLGSQSKRTHCPFWQVSPWVQGRQISPPVPHSSSLLPGAQPVSPVQHPVGQLCGVQHGATQKAPPVGHNGDPAGPAGTQTAPGA